MGKIRIKGTIQKQNWKRILTDIVLTVDFLLLQAYQMQKSCSTGDFFQLTVLRIGLNCMLLLCVLLGLRMILQRWHWALLASSILSTIWSVVDIYVVEFHGSPLFFSEFRSFGTAMDVMGNYSLCWNEKVTTAVLCGLGLVLIAFAVFFLRNKQQKKMVLWKNLCWSGAAFLLCGLFLW